MKTVFDYTNYKTYLKDRLKEERGSQGRLAAALRCHSGYLSQVLSGKAQLSPEQAVDTNAFFNHSKNAAQYFMLLLHLARAGTPALRQHLKEQLAEVLEKQNTLKTRFQVKHKTDPREQALLYSSWHFVAAHMAVLVPALRTVPAIADYLGIPKARVRDVLNSLTRMGLVKESGHGFVIGPTHVHLEHDSPLISKHHANWRLKALASLDSPKPHDLHYSSVVTLSESDAPKVKEILVRAIEEVRGVIKATATGEGVHCYAIDWFSLSKE